jgi:hypothetical protein
VDLEQIEEILLAALKLRSPCFTARSGITVREKIAELEDYLLKGAHVNGELVEVRHWLREVEEDLTDQWDGLVGWEINLGSAKVINATKQQILAAKIAAAPQLYAALRKARRLRESVVDQITRLEREEKVMSRAYTMISGG